MSLQRKEGDPGFPEKENPATKVNISCLVLTFPVPKEIRSHRFKKDTLTHLYLTGPEIDLKKILEESDNSFSLSLLFKIPNQETYGVVQIGWFPKLSDVDERSKVPLVIKGLLGEKGVQPAEDEGISKITKSLGTLLENSAERASSRFFLEIAYPYTISGITTEEGLEVLQKIKGCVFPFEAKAITFFLNPIIKLPELGKIKVTVNLESLKELGLNTVKAFFLGLYRAVCLENDQLPGGALRPF